MKARFEYLKQEMDVHTSTLQYVIYACFVLHNNCEMKKLGMMILARHKDMTKTQRYDQEFQPPTSGNRYSLGNNDEASGKRIRNIFLKFFD